MEKNLVENIKDEEISYSDDALYNITSYGADMSFRELLSMYEDNDLEKPELQRKYVWTKNEASRFIDSLLLGLPVPSIFLAKTQDEKRLIVDGYQRIMTVFDFIKGVFSSDGKVFKLSNTDNINEKWRNKAFIELLPEEQRKIKTSTIHAIIFEQKQPKNDTGMYQIFERINTSGRVLKPQEIRNCVYHGAFNTLLFKLNKDATWRKILGSTQEDSRMMDLELILRIFAFNEYKAIKDSFPAQINLNKYLNQYMSEYSNLSYEQERILTTIFTNLTTYLYDSLGDKCFRSGKLKDGVYVFAKKVNPVIMDAVSSATAFAIKTEVMLPKKDELIQKYQELIVNPDFVDATTKRTTNKDNIEKRISVATFILFGVDYEW